MTGDIYIWDNGGSYSDHAIYFVDADGLTPNEMELALQGWRQGSWDENAFFIARVASVEWRNDKPISVFEILRERHNCNDATENRAMKKAMGPELWKKFAKRWKAK